MRTALAVGTGVVALLLTMPISGSAQAVGLPDGATRLEGVPDVKVETTRETASRHELAPAEGARERLELRVDDGRVFWASREDRPLTLSSAGEFTYLSSSKPGDYVRIRRVNGRLTYVEHVEMDNRSVTYWGELRVVLGHKP